MKIRRIKAINKCGKEYNWSADTLKWDELPEWLLGVIKTELPYYKIEIEYYKRSLLLD